MFPTNYKFEINGLLPEAWRIWFEGMTIQVLPNGNTCLSGEILDSSMLYGVIARLRDLGLVLVRLEKTS